MYRLSQVIFAGAALLLIAPAVNAQYGDRGRRDSYRAYGQEPLDRVRADLNRAERDLNYLSSDEMRRFRFVRDRIFEFQRNWERGRLDREALNEAIRGMENIVDRYRLRPRDRDMLADDVSRLRDMRERYDRGYRR
jgi:hypothetical protein